MSKKCIKTFHYKFMCIYIDLYKIVQKKVQKNLKNITIAIDKLLILC